MLFQKKDIRPKPVVLISLEGWGIAPAHAGNAISEAAPDYFQYLLSHFPTLALETFGSAVGLSDYYQVGGEVGHFALGMGRPVFDVSTKIDEAIVNKNFEKRITKAVLDSKTNNIHLVGLISNVKKEVSLHHLNTILDILKKIVPTGKKIFLHAILDGHDMAPQSGKKLLKEIEEQLETCNGLIATVSGRLYAMDRYQSKSRLEKTMMAIVHGQGNIAASSEQAISESYSKKILDEEFPPTVITDDKDQPLGKVKKNDMIIFFNFNPTLLRPLASLLVDSISSTQELLYASVVDYGIPEIKILAEFSFQQNSLGEVISKAGYRQLRVADSESYVPITVFLNGGQNKSFTGEDRELIPLSLSDDYVKMYEESNHKVAKRIVKVIEDNKYDFIATSFSGLDRIGHTGDIKSAISIVKSIDKALRKVISSVLQAHGVAIIVSSHGLAETFNVLQEKKVSSHTKNPVPLILAGEQFAGYSLGLAEAVGGDLSVLKPAGSLIDVAPTILSLMKLSVPSEMTGQSFIDDSK